MSLNDIRSMIRDTCIYIKKEIILKVILKMAK